MFGFMFTGDPFWNEVLRLGPLAIAVLGFLVGFYWIYRITKDIEDS